MEETNNDIVGVYVHFKGGIYRVVAVARHHDTLNQFVVYTDKNGDFFIREVSDFFGLVFDEGGCQVQRFTKIN